MNSVPAGHFTLILVQKGPYLLLFRQAVHIEKSGAVAGYAKVYIEAVHSFAYLKHHLHLPAAESVCEPSRILNIAQPCIAV